MGDKKKMENEDDSEIGLTRVMIRKTHSDVITEAEDDIEKGQGIVHVASNYDDTSQVFIILFFLFISICYQGAMHSFQDEKGTWWSYTFDERGYILMISNM